MTTSKTDKLVTENMGLVNMVVRRYVGYGTDYEDLFQIGAVGLIKAAKNFDESRNLKFSTYAVGKIIGEIKTYFRDNGSVKISRSIKEQKLKINRAREILVHKLGREPTVSEIGEQTGLSPETIAECMEIQENLLSLDKETAENGELYNIVGEDKEMQNLDRIALTQALEQLTVKERKIIVLRYFLDKTQTEIAELLGISQVSVSRQEKNILKKLAKMIS